MTSNSPAPGDTPESAVRAFFEAFARARETDDPSLIEPYVTGTDSSAYQTAAGFLEGQKAAGEGLGSHGSGTFRVRSHAQGSTATVLFTLREGGYDIDLDTGEPLESPVVLTERRVQATLARSGDRWLLEATERGMRPLIRRALAASCLGGVLVLLGAGSAIGFDGSVDVTVETWTSQTATHTSASRLRPNGRCQPPRRSMSSRPTTRPGT